MLEGGKMKIQISLAMPTTGGPNPKGWKTVIREIVELDSDQTPEEIMESLVNQIRKERFNG